MKILVANDDGWQSPGLWALVEALVPIGEVLVVVPDREQSGVGTAVTLHHPIRASEITSPVEGAKVFVVEGTPADGVILGLEHLAQSPIDVLFSGINQGANLGEDVLVSGTVGAAFQGYCRKVSSVALSVTSLKDVHYEAAARLAHELAVTIVADSFPRPVLLNVNVPNLPPGEIRGVDITRMSGRTYMDTILKGEDGKRQWYWIQRKTPTRRSIRGTDVYAIRHKRISITPIHADLTREDQLIPLMGIKKSLRKALNA